MLSRIAGRVLTSPVAFFVAGLVDVLAFALRSLWRRVYRLTAKVSAGTG